eukprot:1286122-Rhodomonas_salina.1
MRCSVLTCDMLLTGDEPESEEEQDYDALMAKIAESGGLVELPRVLDDVGTDAAYLRTRSIVMPEDLKTGRALKKSKRSSDKEKEAEGKAKEEKKEEEPVELDEHGKPKIKVSANACAVQCLLLTWRVLLSSSRPPRSRTRCLSPRLLRLHCEITDERPHPRVRLRCAGLTWGVQRERKDNGKKGTKNDKLLSFGDDEEEG